MRADRLISLIMLLETRGPVTAKELADKLEVSQRTIYRDIEALSMSGIPVFGAPGLEGGYQLVEGYRSYLDGLDREEVLALLSLDIPEQLYKLEFGVKLKAAILKLRSSYSHLSNREEIANRLYVDTSSWETQEAGEPSPESTIHLNTLYQAIRKNQKVKVTYSHHIHPANIFEKVMEPYGVVTKENVWYLVFSSEEKVRVLEVSRILQVDVLVEYFDYPRNFQLKIFWEQWCSQVREQYGAFQVKALVPRRLQAKIGVYVRQGIAPFTLPVNLEQEEWGEVELVFCSFEEARGKILSMGAAIKVLEPQALRYSLLDYAEQVVKMYK